MRRSPPAGGAVLSTAIVALCLHALLSAPAEGQETGIEEMRLEPGDAVRVELPDRSELTDVYRVAFDGSVLLPLVGYVEVEGRRFGRVRDEIGARFEEALDDPVLRVTPLTRVMVVGQVVRPGYVTVDPADRIGEVLDGAGGLTPLADRGRIRLLRSGEGGGRARSRIPASRASLPAGRPDRHRADRLGPTAHERLHPGVRLRRRRRAGRPDLPLTTPSQEPGSPAGSYR